MINRILKWISSLWSATPDNDRACDAHDCCCQHQAAPDFVPEPSGGVLLGPANPATIASMHGGEQVLGVARRDLPEDWLPSKPSFWREDSSYLDLQTEAVFRSRLAAEKDPGFKQLIPYTLLRTGRGRGARYWTYVRGSAGAEDRLHARRSLGFGGHINPQDTMVDEDGNIDLWETLSNNVHRELQEELGIEVHGNFKILGYVNDDSNEVGSVHLGIVCLITLDDTDHAIEYESEECLESIELLTLTELRAQASSLETWSKLVLAKLNAQLV